MTGSGEHHKFRIELNTVNRFKVIGLKSADFTAFIHIPDVYFAVAWSRQDELRVGCKWGLYWLIFNIWIALNCLQLLENIL